MDPRKLYTEFGLDERLAAEGCAYCGGVPDTVDHVPSKVLLDDPLPGNLPVVPACLDCNRGFSLDEEYFACFLECVLMGTTEPERLRQKIQRALQHSPKLREQIAASGHIDLDGRMVWMPDIHRVEKVVLKLARGHAFYELGSAQLGTPHSIQCIPFLTMSANARDNFERAGTGELRGWPEIGSRAFLRAVGVPPYDDQHGPWIEVQEGRYRYTVDEGVVQIVLAEYLACAVEWV